MHLLLSAALALTPTNTHSTRRNLLHGALGACAAAAAPSVTALPALAYDSIPTAAPDFDAAEKARKQRLEAANKAEAALRPYVKKVEAANDAKAFEEAADELSLFVLGLGPGGIADGVNVKAMVSRIRETYDNLPQQYYKCPKGQEKRDNALCSTPGPAVEAAYASMMKTMRKASMIQLGDFRKVEMAQF